MLCKHRNASIIKLYKQHKTAFSHRNWQELSRIFAIEDFLIGAMYNDTAFNSVSEMSLGAT
jgi:hypothetical protein